MPAYPYWLGTTSGNWGTAANWSTGVVPVTGDSVTIDGRSSTAIDAGLNQSAVTLAALTITLSAPAVGTTAAPLRVSATVCDIGQKPTDGSNAAGPSIVNLDTGTDACALTVFGSRSSGSSGVEPVIWKGAHASNVVRVRGSAVVGIATGLPNDAATLPSLQLLADGDTGPTVRVAAGATLTTVTQQAGTAYIECAFTTLNQDGGTLTTRGTGAVTTMYVRGVVASSSTGTVTTIDIAAGGVVDFSQNTAARTVTNCTNRGFVNANLPTTAGSGHPITFTNGIDCLDGGIVDPGTDITVSLSAV